MQPEHNRTAGPPSSPHADQRSASLPLDTLLKDGMIAGLVGALTIALWFLVIDTIAGRPLYTPTLLGTAFFHPEADLSSPALLKASLDVAFQYSVFHWITFTVMGAVASFCLRLAAGESHLGFGFLLFFALFVVFEFGFRFVRAGVFSQQVDIAWPMVLIGNLLASAVIGAYLLLRHRPVQTR